MLLSRVLDRLFTEALRTAFLRRPGLLARCVVDRFRTYCATKTLYSQYLSRLGPETDVCPAR